MRTTKYLIFALMFILINTSQIILIPEKIVKYQDFEVAYSKNSDVKILSKHFNLLYILLLDTTYKSQFFEYDIGLKSVYEAYSYGLKLDKSTVGFVAHIKQIDEIFNSTSLINKALSCISDDENQQVIKRRISYPVYIKGNTAIVETVWDNGDDLYYFRLHAGVVQINWLGGTIE